MDTQMNLARIDRAGLGLRVAWEAAAASMPAGICNLTFMAHLIAWKSENALALYALYMLVSLKRLAI